MDDAPIEMLVPKVQKAFTRTHIIPKLIDFQKKKKASERKLLGPQEMAGLLENAISREHEVIGLLNKAGSLAALDKSILKFNQERTNVKVDAEFW